MHHRTAGGTTSRCYYAETSTAEPWSYIALSNSENSMSIFQVAFLSSQWYMYYSQFPGGVSSVVPVLWPGLKCEWAKIKSQNWYTVNFFDKVSSLKIFIVLHIWSPLWACGSCCDVHSHQIQKTDIYMCPALPPSTTHIQAIMVWPYAFWCK
jgi:hypothetical protein